MTFTVGPLSATSITTPSLTADTPTFTNPLPTSSGGTGTTATTGTGSNVFSQSPTLTNPSLGAATATSISTGSLFSSTPIAINSGGTGTTTCTGTGPVVLKTSPALDTPSLGVATATSIATGSLSSSTPIPISSGGTGQAIIGSTGQVLTSDGTNLHWSTPSTTGITSVAIAVPSWLTVTGPITSSGTITISGSSTGTGSVVLQTAPTLTTPNLGTATATSITTGSLNSTTPISLTSGGTGLSTPGTNGQVLSSNGTTLQWTTPSATGVTSVAIAVPSWLSVSGPITSSGTITISGSSTGTGSVVLSQSPVLTTPTLGAATATSLTTTTPITPSSGGTGLGTVGTNGQVLSSNGTTLSWITPSTGVTSVAIAVPSWLSVSGPITSSGTITISGTATGTGPVVLQDTPLITGIFNIRDQYVGMTYASGPDGPSISGYGGGQLGYNHSPITTNAGSVTPVLTWSASGVNITGTVSIPGSLNVTGSMTATGGGGITIRPTTDNTQASLFFANHAAGGAPIWGVGQNIGTVPDEFDIYSDTYGGTVVKIHNTGVVEIPTLVVMNGPPSISYKTSYNVVLPGNSAQIIPFNTSITAATIGTLQGTYSTSTYLFTNTSGMTKSYLLTLNVNFAGSSAGACALNSIGTGFCTLGWYAPPTPDGYLYYTTSALVILQNNQTIGVQADSSPGARNLANAQFTLTQLF